MSSTVVLTQLRTETQYENDAETVEDEEEARDAGIITFENCSKGLGIKICGGCSLDGREENGIFVKRILPGGLADIDGNLQQGDQILDVNGESLEGVTNERAVAILRHASASNHVEMIITRDEQAKLEFCEILEKQNGYSNPTTPIPTESQSKHTSRATTPSGYGTDSVPKSPVSNGSVTEPIDASCRNEHTSSPRFKEQQSPCNTASSDQVAVSSAGTVNGHPAYRDQAAPLQTMHPFVKHMIPSMASTPRASGSSSNVSQKTKFSSELSTLYAMAEPSPVPGNDMFSTIPQSSIENSVFRSQSRESLPQSHHMSQIRKLSLDPYVRLKIEKLEVALRYLGLEPTSEQQANLRSHLRIDDSGTVNYGDFVSVARQVFKSELESKNIGANTMLFAANDLTDIIEPPPFNPEMSQIMDVTEDQSDDEVSLRQERNELRQEVHRLKGLLQEKETACFKAEEELSRIKRRAQGAIDETRTLKTKVQLAEQAQRAARSMEQDYEEVVQLLEGEIAKLTANQGKGHYFENDTSMQQKMAVLSCQLKKAEASKKTYEVATEKLLQFAEHVHETMTGQSSSLGTKPLGEAARGNKPPGYLGKHKKLNPKTLASEAKDVVQAVRSIIESEPLPYGWEEAHTSDGMKYYIDHVNQVTTWTHPKSGVQHLPTIRESKDSKQETQPKSVD